MVTVLKLGGSVITEKDDPETPDVGAIERAAAAVAGAEGPLVLVHGAGSFGHYHADRHGVSTTTGTGDAGAVRDIHGAMKRLNDVVVDALAAEGVPAVPVHPLSLAYRDGDGALTLPTGGIERLLGEGFTPVLHGDVIAQAGAGATILSGDEIVVRVAAATGASRVGLCSTVPGVLDGDGEVVPRVDSFEAVADALGASDATDVTGGMAAKVRTLLDLPAPAVIFAPDALAAFLAGESPGTVVGGDGA